MSGYFDLTAMALGAWLLCGICADGWAHNHIHVESFFTPWHAVLYTGYLANAAFYIAAVIRAHRKGRPWRETVPSGYGLAMLGILIFGLSGIGDMTWHLIFGIEVSVSAAFSPPHLGLMIGIGLIVSGPFVAAWKRSTPPARWSEWLPLLLSLALTLSLMTFVTQYASPLVVLSASIKPLRFHDQALGAISILLHAALLMGWILIAIRRWALPRGSLALVLIFNVVTMSFMRDCFFLIPAIALAGVGADVLMWKLDVAPSHRRQFHLFAFVVPVLYYLLYFAAVGIAQGISWPLPLWTGSVFMAGIVSVLLSYLILPPPYPKASVS
jgi:hypothetical protein